MGCMQDLALQYKLITLPSFSIFQEGLLIEHYTGLESCRLMQSRLESEHARTSTTDITTNAGQYLRVLSLTVKIVTRLQIHISHLDRHLTR